MNGEGVVLYRDGDWPAVPPDLRNRVERGVDRIRELRNRIGAEAYVSYMPPVSVAAAVWNAGGQEVIHGMSGAWRDPNAPGGFSIGVLLGAGPALCEDEATVRALLVHEFMHCFAMAKLVVDHNDLGAPLDALRGDSLDAGREEQFLGIPADWFGPTDMDLLRWNDEKMLPTTREVVELANSGQLPWEHPPIVERASFNVPQEWKERIRRLRGEVG